MNEEERKEERRRQQAFHRLGTNRPVCCVCGEPDWRTLELHHLAGETYDADLGVALCRNCHRKQSDPSSNSKQPDEPPLLIRVGQLLIGLAQFAAELAKRLAEYGRAVLEAATFCPYPYGSA